MKKRIREIKKRTSETTQLLSEGSSDWLWFENCDFNSTWVKPLIHNQSCVPEAIISGIAALTDIVQIQEKTKNVQNSLKPELLLHWDSRFMNITW